jgi:hypothetical protein
MGLEDLPHFENLFLVGPFGLRRSHSENQPDGIFTQSVKPQEKLLLRPRGKSPGLKPLIFAGFFVGLKPHA